MKLSVLILISSLVACQITGTQLNESALIGKWMYYRGPQPQEYFDGIQLLPGGDARSINMNTLIYHRWQLDEDRLTLFSTSIGNRQTIEGYETYRVLLQNQEMQLISPDGGSHVFLRWPEYAPQEEIIVTNPDGSTSLAMVSTRSPE